MDERLAYPNRVLRPSVGAFLSHMRRGKSSIRCIPLKETDVAFS
jgi:hypothetical protein